MREVRIIYQLWHVVCSLLTVCCSWSQRLTQTRKAAQTTHPWVRIRWRKKWDVRITTFLWKHCIKQYINFLLNTVKFCMAKTQWPKVFMFPSFACRSLIVRLSIYHFTSSRFSGCTNINPNKYMEILITASIARSKEIIFFCPLVSAFA